MAGRKDTRLDERASHWDRKRGVNLVSLLRFRWKPPKYYCLPRLRLHRENRWDREGKRVLFGDGMAILFDDGVNVIAVAPLEDDNSHKCGLSDVLDNELMEPQECVRGHARPVPPSSRAQVVRDIAEASLKGLIN